MVRFANDKDLIRINELREQVHTVHVEGRPDMFRGAFEADLAAHAQEFLDMENGGIVVAERDGIIVGFACVEYVDKPQSITCSARKFYKVHEVGVDANLRHGGIGKELFAFMKEDAKARGLTRIELSMWEFNQSALKFYESIGFKTYQRYMEFEEI